MSSVALDANVTIKKNKSLKKEYQVGDSLVYKDYVALDTAGDVVVGDVKLNDNGTIEVLGSSPHLSLGHVSGTVGSYSGGRLNLHRDKLGIQVPTPNDPMSLDYGSAGHVLTSGGSSSAMTWGAAALFPNDVSIDNSELKFTSGTSVNATAESPANGGHPYLKFAVADSGNSNALTEYLRINEKGAIGVKDGSSIDFGQAGEVLTSASSTGPPTWTAASSSGASLSANNTFTGTNTFNQDVILGSNDITSGDGVQKYQNYRASGYAELLNSTTLTAYNYGTVSDSINFYPKTVFHSPVEFNSKVPGVRVGAVTGEATTAMFSSGSIANTRFEVDDGNFVVKGQNTVNGASVDNAVYSADYKNLAGEKIIVPSSTAFDPTEDERTGTMKAIRNYIGTLIDIEPPVFAGGRFASGASTTLTASVGDTFDPWFDPVVHTHAGPYTSSTQLSYTGWNGFAANQDWTLMFRIEFLSSLDTNKYFMYHQGAESVWMYVGSGPSLILTWADGGDGARIDLPFTSSTTAGFLSKTVDFALVYDSTNYNGSTASAPDVTTSTNQAGNDLKWYYKIDADSVGWTLPTLSSSNPAVSDSWTQSDSADGGLSSTFTVMGSSGTYGTMSNVKLYNQTLTTTQMANNYVWTTCTDSPTAGPNKGTTQTFTLGADHFHFVDTTTSSGAVEPGTTVLPIANVFDNLTSPVPITYGTITSITQSGSDIDGEAAHDYSGWSVALSLDGTILAVGATSNDSTGSDAGHVRVYKFSSGSWTQLGSDIDGESANDYSGHSVALSSDGTILAVGAYGNDGTGSDAGHVRVYQFSGGSWTQLGSDIDGEAANDYSGYSIALSSDGTIVAVGALYNDGTGSDAGHVRVHEFSGGSWTQLGSDIDGEAAGDHSGLSVALSSDGTILAVGARYNDGTGSNAGHVRVHQFSGGSWTQLGSDIDGEAANDHSGWSVSLSSDGTILAVGARYNDGTGSNAGHVRVHDFSGGSWTQLGSDIDGEAANDKSGYSVSLSSDGTILVVGARANDGAGADAGHVRVYEFSEGSWTQLGSDIDGEGADDNFGWSVAISGYGNRMVVGGVYNDGTATNAGHARAFELVGRVASWTTPEWQASSTWKTAGTYYLRYKATDAAGNDTPNDASHYLTVTVADPYAALFTRTTSHTTETTVSSYGSWNGFNATKAWSIALQTTVSSGWDDAAFFWSATGWKIEIVPHSSGMYVNWQVNGSQERLEWQFGGSLSSGTEYSLAITYDPTAYNAGPGTIPDLANGTQSSSSALQIYFKTATISSGTWTQPSLSSVSDNWDNSATRNFPPGDGSVSITSPKAYSGSAPTVSYLALFNATLPSSKLP